MGAEDQTDSLHLECTVETLEASVVEQPLEVVHFESLLGQTAHSSGHLRQVVPLRWGVLSCLVVDLVGRLSPGRYMVHTEPDIPMAHGHPHIQAGGSPDTLAEAAHKERPCEVAG